MFLLYKYQADIKRAVFENQNYLGLFTIFEFIALSFCDKIFYPFLQDKVRIYFIIFPVLILSFFVLSIVYIMYFEKKKMLQIMSERILNTKISYQNLILEYRDRDLIYHDLKNHLSLLTSLLEAGDTEKALLYAKTISEPIKVLELSLIHIYRFWIFRLVLTNLLRQIIRLPLILQEKGRTGIYTSILMERLPVQCIIKSSRREQRKIPDN